MGTLISMNTVSFKFLREQLVDDVLEASFTRLSRRVTRPLLLEAGGCGAPYA